MRSWTTIIAAPATIAMAIVLALGALPSRTAASDPHAAPVTAAGEHAAEPATAAGHDNAAADDGGLHGEAAGLMTDHAATEEAYEPGNGDAWTRWLQALEHSVAGTAAGHAEGSLLYPLDAAPHSENPAQPYRHLAIAKAVTQLEAAPGRKKDPHGNAHGSSHGAGSSGSPLLALANARNYLNLSEYDQALAWYGRAAAQDAEGHFRRETGRESLAAAICARDTAAAGLAIASTMSALDLEGREGEFVLAMRWLLSRQDGATLGWFVDRTAAPELAADVRVTFWRAYALSWLERRGECLVEIRRLLDMGGRERVLGPRERGWVLTAYADLMLLEGARDEAELRYRRLADSGVPALREWGRLQSAGLAFVANRYGEAAAGYREICQAEAKGAWAEHACAMADIAAQLERLLSEGERYGAAAHYGH
ncbi:MAG: hypothetical protein IPO18_14120 [bacterium]|nr:hypothetical protein [bacterium]